MKKKILLLVSLVLMLAVQGWATPKDSLGIIIPEDLVIGDIVSGDLVKNGSRSNQLRGLIMNDGYGNNDAFGPDQANPSVFNPNWIVPTSDFDAHDVVWQNGWEYMNFSLLADNKAILGVDTVFYLTARGKPECIFDAPLIIEMIEGQGVFDFQTAVIYPEDVNYDVVYIRHFEIKFHPTTVGEYKARFKITGSDNVSIVMTLKLNVVDEHQEHSIHITPLSRSILFACKEGSSDTNQFKVMANNLTGPLSMNITYEEFFYDPDEQDAYIGVHPWDHEMFTIEGPATISPEEAAQGAIVKVKFNPTTLGHHYAKLVIQGDGLLAAVHLVGYTTNSQILVSDNYLSFSGAIIDQPTYQWFTVSGNNLTGISPLNIELNDTTGAFSIPSTSNFIPIEEAAQGAPVCVCYKPTTFGTHKAYITISGGGAIESKKIYLIGSIEDPSITVDQSSLNFTDITVDHSDTLNFTVIGTNLIDDLILNVEETESGFFTIPEAQKRITPEQAANGVNVAVTYKPTSLGTHGGSVTISGGGAKSKTVILNGSAVERYINTNKSSLDFGAVPVNGDSILTFNVSSTNNLTGPLSLTLSGATNMYTLYTTSINPVNAAAGKTVTVKYKPTEVGNHNATVTISGGGADSKTISLKGECINPTIDVSPLSLSFGTIPVGIATPKTLMVYGSEITGELIVTKTKESNCNITVSPTIISVNKATSGEAVTVICTPTAAGSFSGTITISGGDATPETVSISGTAVNPPNFSVNKTSLDFGTIKKGEEKPMYFKVTGSDLTGNLTVSSNSSLFIVSPTTITPTEAEAGRTVTVKYKPTASGTHNGSITISGGGAQNKTVSLSGTCIDPNIYVSKTSLNFGTVEAGSPSDPLTFTVRGSDLTGDLTITKTGSNCSISVSPTIITANKAASGATVTVKCTPTNAGSFSGKITVSGGGAEPKTVNLTGTCIAPNIYVSKTSLNFGTVEAGSQSDPLTFTVRGSDLTGDLTITKTGSNCSISVSPTIITANKAAGGATVTVKCTPTAAGSFSGTITISGGGADSKTVTVSGTAVNPPATLTVTPSSLSFTEQSSKTFKVKGSNLTGSLTLSLTGDVTFFTLSKTSITKAEAASGVTVTVTCKPHGSNAASAKVKITGGGASTKYVNLSYSSSPVMINSVEPDGEGDNPNGNEEFMNGDFLEAFDDLTADVDEMTMDAKVYAEGQYIIIESTFELDAMICDIAGHAWSVNLQAGRNEIPVRASGVYIVRIREKTTKLMLK